MSLCVFFFFFIQPAFIEIIFHIQLKKSKKFTTKHILNGLILVENFVLKNFTFKRGGRWGVKKTIKYRNNISCICWKKKNKQWNPEFRVTALTMRCNHLVGHFSTECVWRNGQSNGFATLKVIMLRQLKFFIWWCLLVYEFIEFTLLHISFSAN